MNDIKSRINEYINAHAEEMEAVLADLVSVPSVKGKPQAGMPFGTEPAKALAKMLDFCEKYGFYTKNHENYVGTADLSESGEPALGVLCHLDVVPAGDGWQSDPFTLGKKDGKLFGRGAIDDKGPAVATLFALRAVKELGLPIRENVRFIFGTDEENGSSDIAYYTKKEALPDMLFTPDGEYPVINLEKGMIRGEAVASCSHGGKKSIVCAHGGTVVNAVPASAYAMLEGFTADEVNAAIADAPEGVSFIYEDSKLTALGRSAHASTPWEGVNALTALMKVLGRLKTDDETAALFANAALAFPFGETNGKALSLDISDERSGPLTLVFSIMDYEGGKLCGKFDIRFPICLNVPHVRELLEAGLAKYSLALASMTGTEPHYVDENSDFIRTLLRVYEEQTGLEGKTIAIGGGTYVHNTSGGVAFGCAFPGEDNHMHGADEFITEQSLLINAKIFANAIYELLK